jgi:hypothetical protein
VERKVEEKETRRKKEKIIIAMASRRRAMRELGWVTFSLDHVRWWRTLGFPQREGENTFC